MMKDSIFRDHRKHSIVDCARIHNCQINEWYTTLHCYTPKVNSWVLVVGHTVLFRELSYLQEFAYFHNNICCYYPPAGNRSMHYIFLQSKSYNCLEFYRFRNDSVRMTGVNEFCLLIIKHSLWSNGNTIPEN